MYNIHIIEMIIVVALRIFPFCNELPYGNTFTNPIN